MGPQVATPLRLRSFANGLPLCGDPASGEGKPWRLRSGPGYPGALLTTIGGLHPSLAPRHRSAHCCYRRPHARRVGSHAVGGLYMPWGVDHALVPMGYTKTEKAWSPKPEPRWDLHGPRSRPRGFHPGIGIVLAAQPPLSGEYISPGGGRGLQNRWVASDGVTGGFDSHVLPPEQST
jgi:hypothetical protein